MKKCHKKLPCNEEQGDWMDTELADFNKCLSAMGDSPVSEKKMAKLSNVW